MVQTVEYPAARDTDAGSGAVVQAALDLKTQGWAVVPDVLSPLECQEYVDGVWTWLESLETGVRRNDCTTWGDDRWPSSFRGIINTLEVSHQDFVWRVRQNPKILQARQMTSGSADIDSVRCLWKLLRLCHLLSLQIANTIVFIVFSQPRSHSLTWSSQAFYILLHSACSDVQLAQELLPDLVQVFEGLWGTTELLSSFDSINILKPGQHESSTDGWLHVDQAPLRKGVSCIQGLVNMVDVSPETGESCPCSD